MKMNTQEDEQSLVDSDLNSAMICTWHNNLLLPKFIDKGYIE